MGQAFTEHHGYPLFDCVSALQKDIRRGNERQAMYWCLEMIPRYELYLWRRLTAITNEDIGLGNPFALVAIPELRRCYFEFREIGKNGPARLVLANTILLLCRSPKTRLADHFQRVVTQEFMTAPERLSIPDYAFDNHTGTGKRMGRGVDFWLAEGCQLEPVADVVDPYREAAEALWRAGENSAPDWPERVNRNAKKDNGQMKLF